MTLFVDLINNYLLITLCIIIILSILFAIILQIYLRKGFFFSLSSVTRLINSYLVFIKVIEILYLFPYVKFLLMLYQPFYRFIFIILLNPWIRLTITILWSIILYLIICPTSLVYATEKDIFYTPYPFDTWSSSYSIDNPEFITKLNTANIRMKKVSDYLFFKKIPQTYCISGSILYTYLVNMIKFRITYLINMYLCFLKYSYLMNYIRIKIRYDVKSYVYP